MNFGALPEGKVGLGIPHGAPSPLVWGTQIIQEFNEGLVLKEVSPTPLSRTLKNRIKEQEPIQLPDGFLF